MSVRPLPFVALALLAACGSENGPAPASPGAMADVSTEETLSDQRRFLVDNAARAGVTVTASGLQYELLEPSPGPAPGSMPAADAVVTVHYVGTLIDGRTFDSSRERGEPATFPLGGVIAGFAEGLQLMSVGSRYRFVMPSELAYGDTGSGTRILPGDTLVFDIELLEIGSS